ncbi:hypothetical protein [Micromonospora sp. NPDC049679]|uniref:hypothetical protein n=1 Tax=Micromonospora sp. NPDC049679 TaxID=3155920 RepID=UPI003400AC0E
MWRYCQQLGIGGGVVGGGLFLATVPVWGGHGGALACIVPSGGLPLLSWTLLRQRRQSTAGKVPAASLGR